MTSDTFTLQQALEALLRKLDAADRELATEVRKAIDAGKDVFEKDSTSKGRGREYRKSVPLTNEEAFQIALNVLQAYFVEQPLFLVSLTEHLREAAVSIPTKSWSWLDPKEDIEEKLESEGLEKEAEIELRTETRISQAGADVFPLKAAEQRLIAEQRANIELLQRMTTFKG